jgi:phosphonoacetaldehyde hydrolase
MSIRLAIFDLGGTIVDRYSLSPFLSLKHAFQKKGLNISNHLIYKDMGVDKHHHIELILKNEKVSKQWIQKYDKYPDMNSTMSVFDEFIRYQMDDGIKSIEILPETKTCINWLGNNSISTGVTTGFSRPIMNAIKEKLLDDDIHIDKYVSSTCLGKPGRPNPHMMREIINHLSISDPRRVIKIDDTVVGIQEGKNAGVITVGVAKWSVNMKMNDYEDDKNMSKEEYVERLKKSREILWSAKPDYVVDSLNELPKIIYHINNESYLV